MVYYFIYILYSPGSDKYYVGQSDDVAYRLTRHNETSEHSYTSKHRPWRLVFAMVVSLDRAEAMKVEKYIKRQKSRKVIEAIIAGQVTIRELRSSVARPNVLFGTGGV